MEARIGEYAAADGLKLRYRCWADPGRRDAVVYLHGIESHSGWFSECAEEICRLGVAVYALDRRGSGLNDEARGHCESFRQLVEDVIAGIDSVKGSHTRIHAAALSWGAKLAVATDILHPGVFSTLTHISPGLFPRVAPGVGGKAAIAIDMLLRPRAPHRIPIEDPMFTSVPKYLEYIANDSARLRRVTAAFFRESVRLDRFLRKAGYQWTAPTQVLLAEHDAIIDTRRTQEAFDSLRASPKRLRIYSGCNHSLQFEKPNALAKDIVDWITLGASADAGR